jgi:hypothetical protein
MNSAGKSPRTTKGLTDQASENTAGLTGMIEEPVLNCALRDFRNSVRAWSDAAYNRPRIMREAAPRRAAWRKAAAWSLASVLAFGVAGGGVLEYQHRQEMTRVAAAREAQRQRQFAEERTREAEQQLARVDSAVARQVPNAMEPLAQLMAEDESR